MKCALPGKYGKPVLRLNTLSNSVADSYNKDLEILKEAVDKESPFFYIGRGSLKHMSFDQICEQYRKARDDLAKSLSYSLKYKKRKLPNECYYDTAENILYGDKNSIFDKIKQDLLKKDAEEHSQD